jgi:hypothetical protein
MPIAGATHRSQRDHPASRTRTRLSTDFYQALLKAHIEAGRLYRDHHVKYIAPIHDSYMLLRSHID